MLHGACRTRCSRSRLAADWVPGPAARPRSLPTPLHYNLQWKGREGVREPRAAGQLLGPAGEPWSWKQGAEKPGHSWRSISREAQPPFQFISIPILYVVIFPGHTHKTNTARGSHPSLSPMHFTLCWFQLSQIPLCWGKMRVGRLLTKEMAGIAKGKEMGSHGCEWVCFKGCLLFTLGSF